MKHCCLRIEKRSIVIQILVKHRAFILTEWKRSKHRNFKRAKFCSNHTKRNFVHFAKLWWRKKCMRRMNTSLGSKFLTLRIRIATLEWTQKKANCVTSGSLQFIKQIELIANNMRIILYDTFKVFSNAMLPVNMLYGDELARALDKTCEIERLSSTQLSLWILWCLVRKSCETISN